MTWRTLGEGFLERELAIEKRAGVEHYVTGQAAAKRLEQDGNEAAVVTYVTGAGAAAMVLLGLDKGEWIPIIRQVRVVGLSVDYGVRELPDDWRPTGEMLEAIERAEVEHT